jgi:hypothetical protein
MIDASEVPLPLWFLTTSGLMSGRAETPTGDGPLPTLRGGGVPFFLKLFSRATDKRAALGRLDFENAKGRPCQPH